MRIALRPSGGRGDYELAGSYGALHPSDILEKDFYFEVTPGLTIPGKQAAHTLHGKTRIRPEGRGRHAYVVISAILLLPQARRELAKTSKESPRLCTGNYTVAGIDVDVIATEATKVFFAPTTLWLRSQGGVLSVDYSERMALVTTLWNAAKSSTSAIALLVKTHQTNVTSGDHSSIVAAGVAIQKHYQTNEDVLPLILRDFGLPDAASVAYAGVSSSPSGLDSEVDTSTPEQSKIERMRKWRKQVDRGPGAREFSLKVRAAYDFRCLFSGERFPKFPDLDSAGVDGSHILPWSTHQLNSISNGICLCKLCHWAFDNGLFRFDFDEASKDYILSIPKSIETGALTAKFDLTRFKASAGPIDKSRLPNNQVLWPSPRHIRALNAMF